MATQLQLTLRRNEAYQRIDQATRALEKAAGMRHTMHLDVRHRDPAIEQIQRMEAIASALEALVKAQSKADKAADAHAQQADEAAVESAPTPPVTVETVEAKPMETVETVEIVPAGASSAAIPVDEPKPKGKAKQ
jgi:hypothetical protein